MSIDYIVPTRTQDKAFTPAWGKFALTGEIGRRVGAFIDKSVTSEHTRRDVWREAVSYFRDQQDDDLRVGYWRGEFWGKLMISAARVCLMTGDEALKESIRDCVYEALQFQRADGYLGTYKDSANVFPCSYEAGMEDVGWACNYNWSVWCRKYTLWGLIETARLLDDERVLDCARRFALQLIGELDRLGARVCETGVMFGLASGSVMKPMLILYRLTGEKKLLDFCLKIAAEWEDASLKPALIVHGLKGESPYRWYPLGDESWISKAYEMMSCYDGLIELYRVTGERRYLDAVLGFWGALDRYERNPMGSVSYCERFAEAANYPNGATELCDVIHWMRLNDELYRVTGEARFMDSFEKAFLNAYLAGLYEEGDQCAFFIRSHGRHWDAEPQCKSLYQHCCLNNAPRGFVNAAQAVASRVEGGVAVNLYLPARVRFDEADIAIGEGYFTTGVVRVNIACRRAGLKLRLRAPAWSEETRFTLNGAALAIDGDWAEAALSAGENIVECQFDMAVRAHDFAHAVEPLPDDDYHVQRYLGVRGTQSRLEKTDMALSPRRTLTRGPLILARSLKTGDAAEAMFSPSMWGQTVACETLKVESSAGYLCRCRVALAGGAPIDLCDFASAANTRGVSNRRFFTALV